MKSNTTISFLLCTFLSTGFYNMAQERVANEKFSFLKKELTQWDPIRGEWLTNSIVAMSNNKPIPDRNFPENFTPFEMLKLVPENNRTNIRIASGNIAQNSINIEEQNLLQEITSLFTSIDCSTSTGRTYGDPHFKSFDGNSYSLQTVGEYILSKSDTQFEVQTRQKASGNDFSLNTAAAMNVAGDRIGVYAADLPDNDNSTPIRVNGNPVYTENSTYYLPHGGTIRNVGKEYFITWPTGEKVIIKMRGGRDFPFMDVITQIIPCSQNNVGGLLGNANGNANDDLDVPNSSIRFGSNVFSTVFDPSPSSSEREKEHLKNLAKNLGSYWRVTHQNTLFDYAIGKSTASFTDLNFPRNHRTINEIPTNQREIARRDCEAMGVSRENLKACIFDRGFLNIPPTPKPVIVDQTNGRILPVVTPTTAKPNINASATTASKPVIYTPPVVNSTTIKDQKTKPAVIYTPKPIISKPVSTEKEIKGGGTSTSPNTPLPISTNPNNGNKPAQPKDQKPSKPVYTPKPIITNDKNNGSKPKPSITIPKNTSTPRPATPRPVIKPKVIVKPKPVVKPKPAVKPKVIKKPVVKPSTKVITPSKKGK